MAVVREDQDLTGLKDTVSLSHLFTGSSVQYSVELVRNITAASASSFSLLTTLPRRLGSRSSVGWNLRKRVPKL